MNVSMNDLPDGSEFNESAFAIVFFEGKYSFRMKLVSLEPAHDE